MPAVEKEFIENFTKKFKQKFSFKQFEILGGAGIIVVAKRE